MTPAAEGSRRGNRITAQRWASLLRSLGHTVDIAETYSGQDCDLLIALHARRSLPSVLDYAADRPSQPLIVALTGTDLYHDLRVDQSCLEALRLATRLVVLQPAAVAELPEEYQDKTRVIYQSAVAPPNPCPPRAEVFEVCVLAHLRPVKDPFRAALAARRLPDDSRIRVLHLGAALSAEMERRARREMKENRRYVWLGDTPRGVAQRILARSRLLVLTSEMEGGANVLSEAIAAGVPVVASRIPGTTGIVGEDYPALFDVGDTDALARLLVRAEADRAFYQELKERIAELTKLVDPARERHAWRDLLAEIWRLTEENSANT